MELCPATDATADVDGAGHLCEKAKYEQQPEVHSQEPDRPTTGQSYGRYYMHYKARLGQ